MSSQTRVDVFHRHVLWTDAERAEYRSTGIHPRHKARPTLIQQFDRWAITFERRFLQISFWVGIVAIGVVVGIVWRVFANVQ